MGVSAATTRQRFRQLHADRIFVMPNPWDIGSARLLASLGFSALATTSSGHAASLGRRDQEVTRNELVDHVTALTNEIDVPLNVDAERCFPDEPGGVAETVRLLGESGASGCSTEDYDPSTGMIEQTAVAAERVETAAEVAHEHGIVLTARAENHVHGIDDLNDTIARLCTYRDAGADVVYAPGLVDLEEIARVVREVAIPVNVLARRNGPSITELESVGVRRVSTGGALAMAAYGALVRGGRELLGTGTSSYVEGAIPGPELDLAFAPHG